MILVDTTILLDVTTGDSLWAEWSLQALEQEAVKGALHINVIVYAELSSRYASVEAVDSFVAQIGAQIIEIPRTAAFLAAKAFARYRAAGGTRTGVLSDFFIGAHATALNIPVLTRDVRRYRSYFPNLRLVAPHLN
ncbi:MAG TPA: PIN domain-containing protein [Rhizobiaceae bacterium]|nr:PIN domain-containing protein [Rhizobiaceae bacterium]